MMISTLNELSTSALFVVASGAASILGIALSTYFYFRGKERFALSYIVHERLLLEANQSKKPFDIDVPISWKGREIEVLTRSFFWVKNIGNKLIERTDLVDKTGEITSQNPVDLLDSQVVLVDDAACNLKLDCTEITRVRFDFDFLRSGDGFILRIDHTGKPGALFVKCHSKQSGRIKRINQNARNKLLLLAFVGMALIIGYFILNHVIFPISSAWAPVELLEVLNEDWFFIVIGSFFVGVVCLLMLFFAAASVHVIFNLFFGRIAKATPTCAQKFAAIVTNANT